MLEKINLVICDDEERFAYELKDKISNYMGQTLCNCDIQVVFSGKSLVEYCECNSVDIIFLDIDMPGVDGFDAMKQIQHIDEEIKVIFVTSHDELAYQAYDYQPYQFVKKSDLKRLDKVIEKAVRVIAKNKNHKKTVIIKSHEDIPIDIDEIIYLKSERNYVLVYSLKDSVFKFRDKISNVYKSLEDDGFIYVHRSYIVNCRFISQFLSTKVILKTGKEIKTSRNINFIREAQGKYAEFERDKK